MIENPYINDPQSDIMPQVNLSHLDTDFDPIQLEIAAAEKKEAEPESSQERAEKAGNVKSLHASLLTYWTPYFRKCAKTIRYVNGDQFSKKIREALRRDGLPETAFNFLLKLVLYISGMIEQNKTKVKATPFRQGDEKKSNLHTVLTDSAMYNSDGDYEHAIAARNAAICGIGWTNNYYDVNAGKWFTGSVSAYGRIMFDPSARSRESQKDWQYLTYDDYFTAEQICNIYDLGEGISDKIMKEASDLEGRTQRKTPFSAYDKFVTGIKDFLADDINRDHTIDDYGDTKGGLYRVVELHEKRYVRTRTMFNPYTQESFQVPPVVMKNADLLKKYMEKYKEWIYRDKNDEQIWVTAICPKLLPDDLLMEKIHPIQGRGFQFKPTFCYDFDDSPLETRSVLDNLLDLQDFINQRAILELTWLMAGVSPDIVYQRGAIDPSQVDTWKSKVRGKLKEWTGGQGAEPKKEHPMTEVGAALVNGQERAWDLRQELSGFSPNQFGQQESSKESGTLYNQRVQTGLVMLKHLFTHIQRAQEETWRYCDKGLQIFMNTPQIVRIAGEPVEGMEGVDEKVQNAYWLKINYPTVDGFLNDYSEGEFDFKVDQTQIGQTAKNAQFMQNLDLVNLALKVDQDYAKVMFQFILKNSDTIDAKEMAGEVKKLAAMKFGIQEQNTAMNALGKQQQLMAGQKQLEAPQAQPDSNNDKGGQSV
jgi:hypothetical protein